MKNIIKSFIILIAGSAFMMVSCGKDDADDSTKGKLTSKSCWKPVKYEEKDGNGVFQDVTSDYAACELDNCNNFKADGTFEENEGAAKCDPSDPQVIGTGSWTLTADEKSIVHAFTGGSVTYNIKTLTGSELVLENEYDRITYR